MSFKQSQKKELQELSLGEHAGQIPLLIIVPKHTGQSLSLPSSVNSGKNCHE
jgi:hypothetical protein